MNNFNLDIKIITLILVLLQSLYFLSNLAHPFIYMLLIDFGLVERNFLLISLLLILFLSINILLDLISSMIYFFNKYLETIYSFSLKLTILKKITNFKDLNETTALLPIFTNDIETIKEIIPARLNILFNCLQLIAVLIIFLIFDNLLFKVALFLLILLPIVPIFLSTIIPKVSYDIQEKKASLTNFTSESLSFSKEIRINRAENSTLTHFKTYLNNTFNPLLKLFYINSIFNFNNVIHSIFSFIILSVGSWLVIENSLSIGQLVAVIAYLAYITDPINNILGSVNQLKVIVGSKRRVSNHVTTKATLEKINHKSDPKTTDIAIETRNYRLSSNNSSFPDFKLEKNEWLLITGSSGGGKTSLLNNIVKLNSNYTGSILMFGNDIRDVSLHHIYTKTYYVLQNAKLSYGSLRENSLYNIKDFAEFKKILRHLGVSYLLNNNDLNINEYLSGGERQRIAVAIGIYKNPEILILDEPTSELDHKAKLKMINTLKIYRRYQTTLIVSHDNEFNFISKSISI